jgi:hypothetical protein
MSVSTSFFKESFTSLGVFYPMHYILAVFDTLPAAQRAEQSLRRANFRDADMLVLSGPEFIELEHRETGVAGAIMKSLSRFFKTEQLAIDLDLRMAEKFAAFLFVYCPREHDREKAWQAIEQEGPIVAQYYDRASVNHLAGNQNTD